MKTTENKGKFVAYYRVSTTRQGDSGLGLEAQQKAVTDYLNGGKWDLVGEYIEVKSGKLESRPELKSALAQAKAEGATVIVAKMDRLGRRASHLLSTIDKSGVRFVFVEMPHASKLEIGIRAVVAEEEGRAISARTKDALQAAKRRAAEKGLPNPLGKNGKKLAAANKAEANRFAEEMRPTITEIRQAGITTVRGICEELNRQGVAAARGGLWYVPQVHALLKRIDPPKRKPRKPTAKTTT